MNDEIKEILDLLKDTADLSFFAVCGTKEELENMPKCVSKRLSITNEQAKTLLDYITNLQQINNHQAKRNSRQRLANQKQQELILKLQQENERLKEELKYTIPDVQHNQIVSKLAKEKNDYKSRCEKAIEYIKNCEIVDKDKRYPLLEEQFGEDLLNILQNGSDSQ